MSRTSRHAVHLALPLLLSAPLALWACQGDRGVPPIDGETSGGPAPVEPPMDPQGEGPVLSPAKAPSAISGGSLIALKDGVTAVAADPDRDRLWIVDTKKLALRGSITLKDGDEPGRGAEDGQGRVWVALRRGGAVVTIDVATMAVTARTPVCAEPRGVAYDAKNEQIHVACVGGELVSFAAATGLETRRLRLDRDLRDVVIDGAGLRVSRFRSAEVLSLDAAGVVTKRVKPPITLDYIQRPFEPAVAWRTIALPGGGIATLHQSGLAAPVPDVTAANAYYVDPCNVIVHTAVTVNDPATPQSPTAGGLQVALAVDLAIAPDGQHVAIAAAGDRAVATAATISFTSRPSPGSPALRVTRRGARTAACGSSRASACAAPRASPAACSRREPFTGRAI